MTRVAIMQPYFFPYLGYFQLLAAVDIFVIYDNIEYSKKGWINRNRILVNGRDEMFTLPLKKDSDYLNVDHRYLSDEFDKEREKLIRRVHGAYKKAPYFNEVFQLFQEVMKIPERNLFAFLFEALQQVRNYLEIQTQMIVSSTLNVDHTLKGENRVLAIASKLNADVYINAIGGRELYAYERFLQSKIHLKFIQMDQIHYPQFNNLFVPNLSILDVLMFNSKEQVRSYLSKYTLI
jgi:hypothetical protein